MRKQALVIGLGQFGMSLSQSLTGSGMEVLAVDLDPALVQTAAQHATEAVCFDASDEDALIKSAPASRDYCICAIGPESRENAIIVTALLRQMGAPKIIARASDKLTERILSVVGAHEVVNPERAFGERLARRLAHEGLLDQVPLGADLVITEILSPGRFVGRNLIALALPKRYEVTVVAIRKNLGGTKKLAIPSPMAPIEADDILVVVSTPDSIANLLEETK